MTIRAAGVGVGGDAVEAVAFGAAVLLPVAYLPLLATGVRTVDDLLLVSALLALHAASIVVGRRYGRE